MAIQTCLAVGLAFLFAPFEPVHTFNPDALRLRVANGHNEKMSVHNARLGMVMVIASGMIGTTPLSPALLSKRKAALFAARSRGPENLPMKG